MPNSSLNFNKMPSPPFPWVTESQSAFPPWSTLQMPFGWQRGEKTPSPSACPGCHLQVQHSLPQGQENAETRELNPAPSTSRISKQLPWGHSPPFSTRDFSVAWAPSRGVPAHCWFTPKAANCRFPGMTDVAAIQCVQARTKASPAAQSQQGCRQGQLQ